jgi:hypothetical protein
MNEITESLRLLTETQKIHIIVLIKHCIRILIIKGKLKLKIYYIYQYKTILKQIISIAASETNITNTSILKYFKKFLLQHTTRGYLFPQTIQDLLLELIQILEYTCIESFTETQL